MRSVLTEDDKALLVRQGRSLTAEEAKTDDYTSQIAKNIPIEVVSFYTGIFALVTSNKSNPNVASVGYLMFFVALIGTVLYSWLKNTKDKVPNIAIKVGMATMAFLIWAYTLWWPFASYLPQDALIGGALVLAYLFASPAVYECITTVQLKLKQKQQSHPPAPQT
jgi:hypothetical protein